jgi:hypothetical protein
VSVSSAANCGSQTTTFSSVAGGELDNSSSILGVHQGKNADILPRIASPDILPRMPSPGPGGSVVQWLWDHERIRAGDNSAAVAAAAAASSRRRTTGRR